MSELLDQSPAVESFNGPSIELVIAARPRDLGGFFVRRTLPSPARRLVGPFIFFDHFGPVRFPPGTGMDVRPHPHIALATVTYLFDGEIDHKDSLGSAQTIHPGDVNWMTAGHGIVHSERTGREARRAGATLHGLQLWVALPTQHEETEPRFEHQPAANIPEVALKGARLRVVAGNAYGASSPVTVLSPTFYVVAELDEGVHLDMPDAYPERAAYVVSGAIECDGATHGEGTMIVFRTASAARVVASEASRIALVGGAPLDGPRHIAWNFVASSPERIERAKRDWREGRFPRVPGDDVEFIPLPE